MATVAGGIDDKILRTAFDAAIENSFEFPRRAVVCWKGEIVAKEDKAIRKSPQWFENERQLVKVLFANFNQAQTQKGEFVEQTFDAR